MSPTNQAAMLAQIRFARRQLQSALRTLRDLAAEPTISTAIDALIDVESRAELVPAPELETAWAVE